MGIVIVIALLVIIIFISTMIRKKTQFGSIELEGKRYIDTLSADIETKGNTDIEIPKGWILVERKSNEWFKYGFSDGIEFPGYGEVYYRTFDVWYRNVGQKEKYEQPAFTDRGVLHYRFKLCGEYPAFKGKELHFEILDKKQGYHFLMTAIDPSERKRWYFGLKSYKPTYLYTQPAP